MDFLIGLLPQSIKNLPTHMDFEGQKKAERIFQITIILFAAVGFVWGYTCEQFSQTVYILAAGFVRSVTKLSVRCLRKSVVSPLKINTLAVLLVQWLE